jgi:AraC-like DNA-binding protein/CheY-like chemotaxis protein
LGSDYFDRFSLVTAAHHFLSAVLPFREPESQQALTEFVAKVNQARQPAAEVDVVLLRCLVILDTQHERRIPSLVDRYLASASTPEGSLAHFDACVRDFLRFRCINNGAVQQAVELIGTRYAEPSLDPRTIADAVGLRLSTLDVTFKRQMGCTISEYVREIRLERSALLLVTTSKSIKEIWVEVGYNHPSNFDHEFKRRFGMNPRDFRSTSILPVAQRHYGMMTKRIQSQPRTLEFDPSAPGPDSIKVLIVDDDDCTRRTLSSYLHAQGHIAVIADTGAEGLRLAKAASPDVILLDFRLDDMDGLTFLRILRGDAPDEGPAVVLFTADWSLYDRRKDIESLRAVLASKLCELNELIELIRYLVSRQPPPGFHTAARQSDTRAV